MILVCQRARHAIAVGFDGVLGHHHRIKRRQIAMPIDDL